MKALIITVVVFLAVVFVGGTVELGGDSIFGHIDSMLGTGFLTKLHHTTFFFLYRGTDSIITGTEKTRRNLEEFRERPIGIDNKKQYEMIDEAQRH
jgi:hypothetical protein